MLPNLLIIGAAKSGTTSLHEYLSLHPEISMSAEKELALFNFKDWRHRVDWYSDQFPDRVPVRGESSPSYSMYPFMPGVPERVHELIPDAKLVYIVREPVERAIRHYAEYFALGLEERSIERALMDFDDPTNPYLCTSRYALQLERFLDRFDSEQILVLDQADLLDDRQRVLREVFRFLRVDESFSSPEFAALHNTERDKVKYGKLGLWLLKRRLFMRRKGRFRRRPLIAPLHQLLSRPIDTTLSADARAALVAWFAPEDDRLRELTNREFRSLTAYPRNRAPAAPLRSNDRFQNPEPKGTPSG